MLSLAALSVVLMAMAGCKTEELASTWSDREVRIDGVNDEWQGATTYIEDKDVSIGLLNDDEFLYVSVSSNNGLRMQVMRAGLTIWFDPEGGKDKWYGINFPIGAQGGMQAMGRRGRGGDRDPQSRRQTVDDDPMTYMELVGPGEMGRRRIPIERVSGIEVKIGNDFGRFVYELKVPLPRDADHLFGIGTKAGALLGVGLETGDMPGMGRGSRGGGIGGRGGGGRGGGGGGRGGGGGGRGGGGGGRGGGGGGRGGTGGGGPGTAEQLKVWTTVQLATEMDQALGDYQPSPIEAINPVEADPPAAPDSNSTGAPAERSSPSSRS